MKQPAQEEPDARRLDGQLLSDLWVFRAAARLGSVTEAAQRLNVTQGAVSQRVQRLEARLEVPLFVRHKGRLSLTDAGSTLLDGMTQVARILNECVSRVARCDQRVFSWMRLISGFEQTKDTVWGTSVCTTTAVTLSIVGVPGKPATRT